jgi:hypothetical protein
MKTNPIKKAHGMYEVTYWNGINIMFRTFKSEEEAIAFTRKLID